MRGCIVHERTLRHYCGEAINEESFNLRYQGPSNELPLFTTFLFAQTREDGTMRFMIRIALFRQRYLILQR